MKDLQGDIAREGRVMGTVDRAEGAGGEQLDDAERTPVIAGLIGRQGRERPPEAAPASSPRGGMDASDPCQQGEARDASPDRAACRHAR